MKNIIMKCKGGNGYVHVGSVYSTTYLLVDTVSSCNLHLTGRVTCCVAFLETVKLEKGRNVQEPLKSQTFFL